RIAFLCLRLRRWILQFRWGILIEKPARVLCLTRRFLLLFLRDVLCEAMVPPSCGVGNVLLRIADFDRFTISYIASGNTIRDHDRPVHRGPQRVQIKAPKDFSVLWRSARRCSWHGGP